MQHDPQHRVFLSLDAQDTPIGLPLDLADLAEKHGFNYVFNLISQAQAQARESADRQALRKKVNINNRAENLTEAVKDEIAHREKQRAPAPPD